MTGAVIGFLVGVNAVMWTQVITRKPRSLGFFDTHPYLGVAVICVASVVASYIEARI